MSSERTLRLLSKILFGIYVGLLLWVVVFKCNMIDSISHAYLFMKEMTLHERFTRFIIPFKDYTEPFFSNQIHILIKDDILNVVLFIPLGLYLAYFVRENKLLWVLAVTFLLSLVFELFQLFSLIGSFATKDVITNMFGSFLGYLFCRIIYRKENSGAKLIVLNVISVVAILVFCPILIYAVVNTASNFDVYVDVLLRRFNTYICYIL